MDRRRSRLALFLAATAAGGLVLDPVLKNLESSGLRPVVAHPVAHGIGKSFPSGHALDSAVCYVCCWYYLPAARGWWRRVFRRCGGNRHRADRREPDPTRRPFHFRRAGRLGDRHHLAQGVRTSVGISGLSRHAAGQRVDQSCRRGTRTGRRAALLPASPGHRAPGGGAQAGLVRSPPRCWRPGCSRPGSRSASASS